MDAKLTRKKNVVCEEETNKKRSTKADTRDSDLILKVSATAVFHRV